MNTKIFIKIVLVLLLVFLIAYTLILLRSEEDVWICENNQWITHGHPDALKPTEACGEVKKEVKEIKDFNECIVAGFAVMESYPRQCKDDRGITHTEVIDMSKNENIILDYPIAEQEVSSPLEIRGKARGSWFFEASFPVTLTNWDGLIIAEGVATAEGDWMTTEFVPFKARLEFKNDNTVSNRGSLILKKDNPSGLTENDDALEITVFFKK